jgi:hypothetical protein
MSKKIFILLTTIVAIQNGVQSQSEKCGIMSDSSGLIQKGTFSKRTQFPWVAMITDTREGARNPTDDAFTGALISRKYIVAYVSAVGELDDEQEIRPIDKTRLTAYLGVIEDPNKHGEVAGTHVSSIEKIMLYPNIEQVDTLTLNDIAILQLKKSVIFSDFIKPVCLSSDDGDSNKIGGDLYAVGFGNNEYGALIDTRNHVKVTLMDQDDCKEKYSNRANFMRRNRSFCVIGNGGPGIRDDRLLFEKSDGVWYLRGILNDAFKTADGQNYRVGSNYPFLYVDASQYTDWINTKIE